MIGQLINHLLQSTFFALAVALLVLAFRKNRARVRYSLWLIASLKFLIPFSMLIALGSQIHWTPAAHEIVTRAASPAVVQTVEQFSQPFTVAIPAATQQTDRRPFAIAALWFCGFAFIMVLRLRAWRGMRLAIRRSQPLDLGLPVEARLSSGVFEPGIVGLWRPMLLLPQGILERLTPSELEAVIAHELCHIRHRDNLFAAIHMLIEALFWFHPLIWWIGARLLDERERACDEYVISLGNQPDIYADAILNVCKLYTESPLACVSGITGADIRRRLEAIMSNQKVAGLNFAKKTVLACAAIVAVAGPVSIGLLIGIGQAPHLIAQSKPALPALQPAPPASTSSAVPLTAQKPPSFDAASIRLRPVPDGPFHYNIYPNRLDALNLTLRFLICDAFDIPDFQLAGLDTSHPPHHLDLAATTSTSVSRSDMRLMLQNLLIERFHLATHWDTKMESVLRLEVMPGGPKMQTLEAGYPSPNSPMSDKGALHFTGPMSIRQLSESLTRFSGNPVLDATSLEGYFKIDLTFAPETPDPSAELSSAPLLVDAVREQLGLKLTPAKEAIKILVVDHADDVPVEN